MLKIALPNLNQFVWDRTETQKGTLAQAFGPLGLHSDHLAYHLWKARWLLGNTFSSGLIVCTKLNTGNS
jgi:hypothetical protein